MAGQSCHSIYEYTILHVRTKIFYWEHENFAIKPIWFCAELNSLQNKPVSSLVHITSMESKSRKTVSGQGHFFGN